MQPLISIIIPTYNAGKTIEGCLKSIVIQTSADVEVLIIDGNSKDETLEILKRFSDAYGFISFISEQDRGIYDAMNKGIPKANGKWLYFLGSDDLLNDKQTIEKITPLLSNSSAKIIYGNVVINGNNEWRHHGDIYAGKFNLKKILEKNISQQAVFYNAALFNKLGLFNIKYIVSADYDFMLKCFASGIEKMYVDIVVARFSVGGTSTVTWDKEFEQDKGMLIAKYFFKKLYYKEFMNQRLYIKHLAINENNAAKAFYCLVCFVLQKSRSLLLPK